MKRLAATVLMLLIAFVVSTGVLNDVTEAEAATGYEQWTDGWSDGCFYYWDGYAYTFSLCGNTDGSFNFYSADGYGNWAYTFSGGTLADGTSWIYYQGLYYYQAGVQNSTLFTVTAPTNPADTGIPQIDSIVNGGVGGSNTNWSSPVCTYTVGNVCYVG